MPSRVLQAAFTLCFAGVALAAGADAGSLEAHLKRFEGRWTGEFELSSPETGYEERFAVEQRYWWEEGELKGLAVYERDGRLVDASSRSFVADGRLVSEVRRESGTERFLGIRTDAGVIWLPARTGRSTEQQTRESIMEDADGPVLVVEGFETYIDGDRTARLVYRARLRREDR